METYKMVKRCLLMTLLLPFISLIPYDGLNFTRTVYYNSVTVIIASYIFLFNFPFIIKILHKRSIKLRDLEDNKYVNPVVRTRFWIVFIIMLQIFGAIMITGIVNYYVYRYPFTTLSSFEISGVIGGFIYLISKIKKMTGNILLSFLNHIKNQSSDSAPRNQSRVQNIIKRSSKSSVEESESTSTCSNFQSNSKDRDIEIEHPSKLTKTTEENVEQISPPEAHKPEPIRKKSDSVNSFVDVSDDIH